MMPKPSASKTQQVRYSFNNDFLLTEAVPMTPSSAVSASDAALATSAADLCSRPSGSDNTSQVLTKFTLFPKLPTEIRFMIWHSTFPRGRSVNFGNELVFKTFSADTRMLTVESEEPLSLPTSLLINQGSRQKILKNYTVLFRGDSDQQSSTKSIERPFCYDPKLDTA
jgi:hypothetical protein